MNLMPSTPRTYAIGAHELRPGHVLVGDAICPTRFGCGVTVVGVERSGSTILVVFEVGMTEYPCAQTVHVTRASDR